MKGVKKEGWISYKVDGLFSFLWQKRYLVLNDSSIFISTRTERDLHGWLDAIFAKCPLLSGVSSPTNFTHKVHVGFDPKVGNFVGVPDSWAKLLQTSEITYDDWNRNSKAVIKALQFYEDYNGLDTMQFNDHLNTSLDLKPLKKSDKRDNKVREEGRVHVSKESTADSQTKQLGKKEQKVIQSHLRRHDNNSTFRPHRLAPSAPATKNHDSKTKWHKEDLLELKNNDDSNEIIMKMKTVAIDVNPRPYFQLVEKAGQGASGAVYLSKRIKLPQENDPRFLKSHCHRVVGERVAIKQIRLSEQPKKQLIMNELLVMNDSRQENIVNFLEAYIIDDEELWVIMEYMEGGCLTDILDAVARSNTGEHSSPLNENQMAYIVKRDVPRFEVLHNKKIIHRDIKSDNILLNSQGLVKITDFGFVWN
ncbi:CMF_HP2_G0043480.mRNA.1.CDS.1 [Saccharomyces cerevisiae]|nr:CMF_HP2_G0043480.mRNA.1.CDS.1 [Saccharomyces cerevisiae]CAI6718278.1 CMF_HP2_G0043480.mRNA.1.CDS.1 [Saccharomyces cerevisiae]